GLYASRSDSRIRAILQAPRSNGAGAGLGRDNPAGASRNRAGVVRQRIRLPARLTYAPPHALPDRWRQAGRAVASLRLPTPFQSAPTQARTLYNGALPAKPLQRNADFSRFLLRWLSRAAEHAGGSRRR